MGYPTYNVGVSGQTSRKIILGVIENGYLVYSGYNNKVKIKHYSYNSTINLQAGHLPQYMTGGEGGPVGPYPPFMQTPVVVKSVPGEWTMMVTSFCNKGAWSNSANFAYLWWSKKHPDKWLVAQFSGGATSQKDYDKISDYGVLVINGMAPQIRIESSYTGDPRMDTIIGYYSGTSGYDDFGTTYPNAIATDKNPNGTFPGDANTDDPTGGDGTGPDSVEDDPIEIPEDPTISAANAGLLTLYTPTLSQIHNFGSYLWSDAFSLDTFKKLFSDPMEAVIGLSVVPVSVPTAGAQNIIIGVMDSGVSANRAASQYVSVDCGTIKVSPVWNTALDFEPYTKFSIFLPFIGTREISTDDIMGKDVNIRYLVDILSGACTAHIKVGGSVLYQFSGSCTTPIPISALNWSNLVTSSIGLLAGGTAAAATGGAAGAVALTAMTAGAVARSKPNIQRAGNVSGAAGMLGVKVPYLIRETPRQSLAKGYNKFVGYPSNITSKLADLKGYTKVENVHLEGIPATGDELSEIESLLKEGVIL